MRRFFTVFGLILMFCSIVNVQTYALSQTQSESGVFLDEDGKYYEIINGKKYEVDIGSSGDGNIADAFKNYEDTTKPDSSKMQEYAPRIQSTTGLVISLIIYLIFALTAFTTACDLLFIGIPSLRPTLSPEGDKKGLVSAELKSVMSAQQSGNSQGVQVPQNTKSILVWYFKRRAVVIVYMVVVLMLLVTTSLFTDMGFNIGELISDGISSFLGL